MKTLTLCKQLGWLANGRPLWQLSLPGLPGDHCEACPAGLQADPNLFAAVDTACYRVLFALHALHCMDRSHLLCVPVSQVGSVFSGRGTSVLSANVAVYCKAISCSLAHFSYNFQYFVCMLPFAVYPQHSLSLSLSGMADCSGCSTTHVARHQGLGLVPSALIAYARFKRIRKSHSDIMWRSISEVLCVILNLQV